MLMPDAIVRKRRLDAALASYPIYNPPHKRAEYLLSEAEAQENFDHFVGTIPERLSTLIAWFSQHYSAPPNSHRDGLFFVLEWFANHVGLIMPNDGLVTYEPAWDGANRGANVVLDLLTWYGDEMRRACPGLEWAMVWDDTPWQQKLAALPDGKEKKAFAFRLKETKKGMHDHQSEFYRKPFLTTPKSAGFFTPYNRFDEYCRLLREAGSFAFWLERITWSPVTLDETINFLANYFNSKEIELNRQISSGE